MESTVLGVDLGGTKILIGELDKKNQLLHQRRFPSDVSSQENALQQIIQCLRCYLKEEEISGRISQLCVAVVGRVDPESGVWFEIHPGNSQEIRLKEVLEAEFQVPVLITNDVSAAVEAERCLGIGRQTDNFIYLNVGTGIAGRVVSRGLTVRGGNFNAGEVGHTVVAMGAAPLCACGRQGCIEAFASGMGMSNECHRLQESLLTNISIKEDERVKTETILAAYQQDDPLAVAVLGRATAGLAELIMNLVRVSDPEAVVVGGGVLGNQQIFELVCQQLNPRTMRYVTQGVQQTCFDANLIALKGCGVLGFAALEGSGAHESFAV